MNSTNIFWMQILESVALVTAIAVWYVWPLLKNGPRSSALIALLFVHVPRYVGMVVLVPHMVDPNLPRGFLSSTAYGDLAEAVLALVCIVALRSNWRVAVPLVWVTNTWGLLDLLNGLRSVIQLNVPSFHLGTLWYIYIFYAPVAVVAHIMIFWTLTNSRLWKN